MPPADQQISPGRNVITGLERPWPSAQTSRHRRMSAAARAYVACPTGIVRQLQLDRHQKPLTHHLPRLPSRPPSTHTPWSGRGSGRQGGARHCTNDLDALGRDCSALPGSKVVGMGAPRRSPRSGRHSRTAPRPIPESERPRRRHPREAAGLVLVSCPTGLSTAGARRRRQRRAGRRQERGRSQSREARPAERSAAGCLDEVEKPVTALRLGQEEGESVARSRLVKPAWRRRWYASDTSAGTGWRIMNP